MQRQMRAIDSWTAFLAMLFLVPSLCGLFASYATSLPYERALARTMTIDELQRSGADRAEVDALRPKLGSVAPILLTDAPLAERIARARATVAEEAGREAASIGFRTRLMLGVVTLLSAGLGIGILTLLRHGPRPVEPDRS